MAASTPQPLSRTSRDAFIEYYKYLQNTTNTNRDNFRSRLEKIDRAYQREEDRTYDQVMASAANNAGDKNKFQNITIPVIKPQVETAVEYQTAVFLTGIPIFGVTAAPQFIDQALQMETVIDNQAIRGGWTQELMLFFRDGFKYNFAPIELDWCRETTAAIETNIEGPNAAVSKKVIWEGNSLKRWDPYNTFVDTRVDPVDVYSKGEFAGNTILVSRIELKSFIESLPDKIIPEIVPAFESGVGSWGQADASSWNYYIPDINPLVNETNLQQGTNWMSWAGLTSTARTDIEYKQVYELTKLYCKVIPSEFDLRIPNRNIPQIYKLYIVNHQHIIYCERQTNAHGWLPVLIGQPYNDGLGYQTKSLAKDSQPFQDVTSTYMNSILASRRRAVSDRTLYDPSRILAAHINSDNPSAKIPVRPSAYGKNVAEAAYAFPYREDQAIVSMQQIRELLALSNHLVGQNQASQGQFVKGNKTRDEFKDIMKNANGRDQMTSILLEAQVLMPLKHMIKQNILQYQGGTSLFNREKKQVVDIDPVQLRKAVMEFRISDGLMPSSKILSTDTLSVALQVLGSSPQLGAGYNLAPMFSYLMKAQGAELTEFEKSPEQMAYEQALGAWQQQMQLAIEKGIDTNNFPPQPKPADYGYQPAGQVQPQ